MYYVVAIHCGREKTETEFVEFVVWAVCISRLHSFTNFCPSLVILNRNNMFFFFAFSQNEKQKREMRFRTRFGMQSSTCAQSEMLDKLKTSSNCTMALSLSYSQTAFAPHAKLQGENGIHKWRRISILKIYARQINATTCHCNSIYWCSFAYKISSSRTLSPSS